MIKKLSLTIAFLSMVLFAACQPTPAQVFVVEKDTERMMEQASSVESGTLSSALGHTGRELRL